MTRFLLPIVYNIILYQCQYYINFGGLLCFGLYLYLSLKKALFFICGLILVILELVPALYLGLQYCTIFYLGIRN
jgi:hypothetical protein